MGLPNFGLKAIRCRVDDRVPLDCRLLDLLSSSQCTQNPTLDQIVLKLVADIAFRLSAHIQAVTATGQHELRKNHGFCTVHQWFRWSKGLATNLLYFSLWNAG